MFCCVMVNGWSLWTRQLEVPRPPALVSAALQGPGPGAERAERGHSLVAWDGAGLAPGPIVLGDIVRPRAARSRQV